MSFLNGFTKIIDSSAQTIVGTNKYRLEKVGPIAILIFAGVVAIFGPGTSVAKAACQIMEIMLEE